MSVRKQPTKRYRIPILIDRNERTMFRELAAKRGVTVAELVRQLVAEESSRTTSSPEQAA
jgi:hypothetical protein